MHTCIHACMHTYMHACMHTCIHAYMHMHICIHACIHAYMQTCMHTCIPAYLHICTCIHANMHTCIHTCMIYMHTYICIYNYIYMWFSVCIQQYQVIFCMQLAYTMVIAGVATEVHYPDFCFLWWFNFISYRILLCSYFCILMFWWVRIFILVGSLIIHLSGMCPCVCWFFSNVCDGTPFNSNIAWSCTQAHRKTICRPNI